MHDCKEWCVRMPHVERILDEEDLPKVIKEVWHCAAQEGSG